MKRKLFILVSSVVLGSAVLFGFFNREDGKPANRTNRRATISSGSNGDVTIIPPDSFGATIVATRSKSTNTPSANSSPKEK